MSIAKDTIIYKKFKTYRPLHEMTGLEWFALTSDYGTSYGDITKKYKFKKTPNLLDIGDGSIREMVADDIKEHHPEIIEYSDPDQQYSGGNGNKKYHNLVKTYFDDEYEGTIIDSENLKASSEYTIESMDGPTEIVIWKDFTELLEEVDTEGGKKRRKRTLKKRKKQHKKSFIKSKKFIKFKM
jgi:hypothetical protein